MFAQTRLLIFYHGHSGVSLIALDSYVLTLDVGGGGFGRRDSRGGRVGATGGRLGGTHDLLGNRRHGRPMVLLVTPEKYEPFNGNRM